MTRAARALLIVLVGAIGACGGGGGDSDDTVVVIDAGLPDGAVAPGGLYDSPDDFDRGGCVAGSLAGLDPQGIYHLQVDVEGERSTTAARFDVLAPGQFAGVLAGRDVTTALATGDDLFWSRRIDDQRVQAVDLCAVEPDGLITGRYVYCNTQGCVLGSVTGKRVVRLAEAPASGLALLGEHAGATWGDGITVNVRVLGKYAYVARYQDGLRIVDISDPAAMIDVGHGAVESGTGASEIYNDVKLVTAGGSTFAIMASNRAGAVVWNVDNPAHPTIVAHLGTPVGTHPLNVHSLIVDGGRAYLANVNLGLEIYDVANPAAPVRLGELATPLVDGALLHDLSVQGDRAYLNFWTAGMVVADVSNPAQPVALGTFANYGETTSHSNWVTTVGARSVAAHGDEQWGSHLRLVDVTSASPTFVQQLGEWQTRPEVSAHNIMAFGSTVFMAYYQDGIRLIDISDPAAPRQVAWFDTWPGYDRGYGYSFYEGAVGLDVDLARRRVYVADSNRGLLILSDTRQ